MNYIETLICAIIGAGATYVVVKAAYEIMQALEVLTALPLA